jgi:hypothetical protein
MGDSMVTIYHVVLVTFIAFTILGVSAVLYDYSVNTRDSTSMLVARAIVDCIAPNGFFDLDSLDEKDKEDIFSFCGFNEQTNEEVFVSLKIMDGESEVDKIIVGNEELLWVRRIYTSGLKSKSIEKYEPGYFNGEFFLNVLKDGKISRNNMIVEVIVKHEE